MLLALAMLAATDAAPISATSSVTAVYVADYVPAKTLTLDPKKICRDGFVDPERLAVQMMIQLEMFDELRTASAQQTMMTFDGRPCAPRPEPDLASVGTPAKGACAASIYVQRLLLNIYPGYLPTRWMAELHGVKKGDLEDDVAQRVRNGRVVETDQPDGLPAFAQGFLNSTAEDRFVECDFAPKGPPRLDPAGTETLLHELPTIERNGLGADAAEGAMRVGNLLRIVQFRQYSSNLVYRGRKDSFADAHASFNAGQDLYSTDGGVSLSLGQEVGDEADAKRKRAYQYKYQGAIGVPLCGLWRFTGEDCASRRSVPGDADKPLFTYDVIPYYAFDSSFKKETPLATPGDATKTRATDQDEVGIVTFLATADRGQDCVVGQLLRNVTNCSSYFAARGFRLWNYRDGSELDGLSLRYTPIIKTGRPGLNPFDICINTVCGDPDRPLRMGMIADLRLNQGWFQNGATGPVQAVLNKDYSRIGGRIGFMGIFNAMPDTPVTFWTAYTDFAPLRGVKKDLGQLQTQVNFTFSAATISFEWRNGRREDTAKRDSIYGVKVGFKTK